ncbi:hypothetical protein TorRG33x02_231040 [Trema orientale]|uniref:Transmembrane protein n=1 Tax=Trema orientale TaxID=63057 RepID=A0A2P5E6B8_TREOI|nr:hypothetical protein TorRG33x02_231040 [Trema orientale]
MAIKSTLMRSSLVVFLIIIFAMAFSKMSTSVVAQTPARVALNCPLCECCAPSPRPGTCCLCRC